MDFALDWRWILLLKNGDGLIYEHSNNDKIENIDKRICESEQMQVFASWIMMWWPWHRRCLEDGPIRGQAGATLTNERAETGCHDMSPTSQVTSLGELKRPWHERDSAALQAAVTACRTFITPLSPCCSDPRWQGGEAASCSNINTRDTTGFKIQQW